MKGMKKIMNNVEKQGKSTKILAVF